MPTTACLPPQHASPFHPGGSSGTSSRLTYLVVVLLDSLIGEGGPAPGELLRTKLPVVRSSTTAPEAPAPLPARPLYPGPIRAERKATSVKCPPLRGPPHHSAHAQYQPTHLLSGSRSHTWRDTSLPKPSPSHLVVSPTHPTTLYRRRFRAADSGRSVTFHRELPISNSVSTRQNPHRFALSGVHHCAPPPPMHVRPLHPAPVWAAERTNQTTYLEAVLLGLPNSGRRART